MLCLSFRLLPLLFLDFVAPLPNERRSPSVVPHTPAPTQQPPTCPSPLAGLYFHEVSPNLICGTQPRSAADISTLASLGFTHIINLQTDKDMQHWSTPIGELQRRAQELGVKLIRRPVRQLV